MLLELDKFLHYYQTRFTLVLLINAYIYTVLAAWAASSTTPWIREFWTASKHFSLQTMVLFRIFIFIRITKIVVDIIVIDSFAILSLPVAITSESTQVFCPIVN